jgi:GT2 family glycosyltransferase
MISIIIGHKNRTHLLVPNLQTLLAQTDKNFEIVIVDNSSPEGLVELKRVVNEARQAGLTIKGLHIDPTAHPMSHPVGEYGGAYNPALAQNIGVLAARGDVVCLTSPEVINASTNVEVTAQLFSDGKSRFALGWIDERHQSAVGNISAGISVAAMKALCVRPGNGAMCRDDVAARPWLPINYFLGYLRRDDFIKVGGIDERFLESIGYEDDFFARCCAQAGFPAEFTPSIAGIHLSHSRGYQFGGSNKALYESLKHLSVANEGFNWGSREYIREEF